MTLSFGIDMSSWQYSADGTKKPDFDKVNSTCDFVAVRAGISWGYTDKWFSYSWGHLTVPRLAYHVVYPGESAIRQMEHFLRIVNPGEHDRLVLDMELDHGYSKARITQTLYECLDFLVKETGRYPIVYSRASWINQFVDTSQIPSEDWWLAGYRYPLPSPQYTPEMIPPPALPKGVSNWLIHQTGEKGNGSAVGVASHYVDTNRWNGTKEQMLAYFGLADGYEPLPPEPEPEPPDEDKLFDAKVITTYPNRLRTRYSPAGSVRPEVDWYQSGQTVSVYETKPDWYRTAVETWASSQWMRRLDTQPPLVLDLAYWGPIYNQRDKRWKDLPLGTKSTIGANGCLMTCASMVCNYFGHASNPYSFNKWLTENEGYLSGNLFLWAAIERLYPDMKFDGFVYNPTEQQIADYIRRGQLPIMHVDFDDSTPLIEMHWVLGIGVENGHVVIADPWTGTMGYLFDMYPKAVIRFGSYRRM